MPVPHEQLKQLLAAPLKDEDLQKQSLRAVLQNVQGNILHSHGRDFAAHIFLQFKDGQQQRVKEWLHHNIVGKILSAQDQLAERKQYPTSQNRPALFVTCFLSAWGYWFFGWCDPMDLFSAEFAGGMKQAKGRLHDPLSPPWEENYQQESHAMILVAHSEQNVLDKTIYKLETQLSQLTTRYWIERGEVLRRDGRRVEHFGYAGDGASQPLFFQQDLDKEERERGIDQWNPGAGPQLVLTHDPLGGALDYGSYLVFRKLEQDVEGFAAQLRTLTDQLRRLKNDDAQWIDEEYAAALVAGRFRNGQPLIHHTISWAPPGLHRTLIPNNFRYDMDWNGQLCPFHAHARRMNPRWETNLAEYDRRIARRGIPYGVPGTKPVGLLFMCYQQSLKNQFEALQGEWAYTPKDFPPSGYDGLIGRKLAPSSTGGQHWHIQGGTTEAFIGNCVTLKGGEYFFAPSLNVLRNLLRRPRL